MSEPRLLHRRHHKASHFQVFLMDKDQVDAYPDYGHGGSLATFSPHGVAVSTASDECSAVASEVEIAVTGYGCPNEEQDELKPVADGVISIAKGGVTVGSIVLDDLETLVLAEGRYVVTVYTDTLAPFTARKVRFHLMRL